MHLLKRKKKHTYVFICLQFVYLFGFVALLDLFSGVVQFPDLSSYDSYDFNNCQEHENNI